MKFGIITFHSVINYGSALQAYAMQEGIAKQGVETELIDYRPDLKKNSFLSRIINNRKRIFSVEKWKRLLSNKRNKNALYYLDAEYARNRTESFHAFQEKYFRLSERVVYHREFEKIETGYDGFVCGSDQIWNPTYIGHDMSYFLDFVKMEYKRVAYAPSIAVSEFPKEYRVEIKNEMKRFSNISVREQESVAVVYKLTGQRAAVVVDPTLLLSKKDWERIEKPPKGFDESVPYIFCYFLGSNAEYMRYVDCLKELTELPIVLVTCTELKIFRGYGDIQYEGVGPSEFVYLIHNSEFVCTDSFHGTVFSILNERRFFTFKRYKDQSKASENSRIYTLLNMAGCLERLIGSKEEIMGLYKTELDYQAIHERIDRNKITSEKFLKEEVKRIWKFREAE